MSDFVRPHRWQTTRHPSSNLLSHMALTFDTKIALDSNKEKWKLLFIYVNWKIGACSMLSVWSSLHSRRLLSTLLCPSNGLSHLHRNFLSIKHTTVLAIPKVFVKFERKIQYLNDRASEVLDFNKKPTAVAPVVTFQSIECSPLKNKKERKKEKKSRLSKNQRKNTRPRKTIHRPFSYKL